MDDDPVFAEYLDNGLFGAKAVDPAGNVVQDPFHLVLSWTGDIGDLEQTDLPQRGGERLPQTVPARVGCVQERCPNLEPAYNGDQRRLGRRFIFSLLVWRRFILRRSVWRRPILNLLVRGRFIANGLSFAFRRFLDRLPHLGQRQVPGDDLVIFQGQFVFTEAKLFQGRG